MKRTNNEVCHIVVYWAQDFPGPKQPKHPQLNCTTTFATIWGIESIIDKQQWQTTVLWFLRDNFSTHHQHRVCGIFWWANHLFREKRNSAWINKQWCIPKVSRKVQFDHGMQKWWHNGKKKKICYSSSISIILVHI